MSALVSLTAAAVRAICARRAAAFAAALEDTARAQQQALRRIVGAVASTAYARELGLDAHDDVDAFRRKVPICDYAALESRIARQRETGAPELTPGRVRAFEPTSGSSGVAKYIPYNDTMLDAFRGMFYVWADDLLRHALRPRTGRLFMSISPARGARGLADDSEYLGPGLRALFGRYLVRPALDPTTSVTEFRDALALSLIACADLEIVSIWNPSYLLVIMQNALARRDALSAALPAHRRRLLEHDPVSWVDVWPRLQLVSCWTAATAAPAAQHLAALLPHALMQGKGLLATEAPISVPLTRAQGCVALVDTTFIELEAADGVLYLLHEAPPGEYSILITQPGGLLRYRLGDRVRIVGRYRSAPLIEFIGRTDDVVDLVGEKLHEQLVARTLAATTAPGAFCTLLPLADRTPAHYRLLTDDMNPALASLIDARLSEAHRYGEARALGQLGAIEVSARPDMRARVHEFFAATGMAAGNIKDRALLPSLELAGRLDAFVREDQRVAR